VNDILLLAILGLVLLAAGLTLRAAHLVRPVDDGREWR
jgi:hypothetical protein